MWAAEDLAEAKLTGVVVLSNCGLEVNSIKVLVVFGIAGISWGAMVKVGRGIGVVRGAASSIGTTSIVGYFISSSRCIEGIATLLILEGGLAYSITSNCCSTSREIEELLGSEAPILVAKFIYFCNHASSLSLFL